LARKRSPGKSPGSPHPPSFGFRFAPFGFGFAPFGFGFTPFGFHFTAFGFRFAPFGFSLTRLGFGLAASGEVSRILRVHLPQLGTMERRRLLAHLRQWDLEGGGGMSLGDLRKATGCMRVRKEHHHHTLVSDHNMRTHEGEEDDDDDDDDDDDNKPLTDDMMMRMHAGGEEAFTSESGRQTKPSEPLFRKRGCAYSGSVSKVRQSPTKAKQCPMKATTTQKKASRRGVHLGGVLLGALNSISVEQSSIVPTGGHVGLHLAHVMIVSDL
jgi:hypothetical protein